MIEQYYLNKSSVGMTNTYKMDINQKIRQLYLTICRNRRIYYSSVLILIAPNQFKLKSIEYNNSQIKSMRKQNKGMQILFRI